MCAQFLRCDCIKYTRNTSTQAYPIDTYATPNRRQTHYLVFSGHVCTYRLADNIVGMLVRSFWFFSFHHEPEFACSFLFVSVLSSVVFFETRPFCIRSEPRRCSCFGIIHFSHELYAHQRPAKKFWKAYGTHDLSNSASLIEPIWRWFWSAKGRCVMYVFYTGSHKFVIN